MLFAQFGVVALCTVVWMTEPPRLKSRNTLPKCDGKARCSILLSQSLCLLVLSQYGTMTSVWVARQPPGFGFVEFADPRDAEVLEFLRGKTTDCVHVQDAVKACDGKELNGRQVKVELSNGRPKMRAPTSVQQPVSTPEASTSSFPTPESSVTSMSSVASSSASPSSQRANHPACASSIISSPDRLIHLVASPAPLSFVLGPP